MVIGAGPSGCTAAMTLSEMGIDDVIVLERLSPKAHGRYHSICGEAVSDKMFQMIGYRPKCIITRVSSISIDFPGKASISIPVEGSIVDRNAMIADLRSHSSARFIRGTVTSIDREGDAYIVHTADETYKCRHLIGADGAHSVVRRDVFESTPEEIVPIINHIVPGNATEGVLRFIVSTRYKGGYKWEFPSAPGTMSVGFPKGTDHIPDPISKGARNMPIGRLPSITTRNCCLIGDAASLGNPMCFGGIGVGMLSARKAVQAMVKGDLEKYQHWVDHDRMFSRHFMEAHRMFMEWDDEDIADAMVPFRSGYSVLRGAMAIARRPKWRHIYVSCWMGFSKGW